MRICVMQPALYPPASYLRLFAATDLFVVLDNVQFSKTWYTHRQKLTDKTGKQSWLTLPLKTHARNTLIKDLQWAENAQERWESARAKFYHLTTPLFWGASPMAYVVGNLSDLWEQISEEKFEWNIGYASDVNTGGLKGQDRIIAICKAFMATEYINTAGGKELYDKKAFAKEGIKLTFLKDYQGSNISALERISHEPSYKIREEIYDNL